MLDGTFILATTAIHLITMVLACLSGLTYRWKLPAKLDMQGPIGFRRLGPPERHENINAISVMLMKNCFNYIHQELTVTFSEYKKQFRKKYLSPGCGAPLEGGACWLCRPSFYSSLAPVKSCKYFVGWIYFWDTMFRVHVTRPTGMWAFLSFRAILP